VSYLRRKLDGDGDAPLIHTVRGIGYVLRARRTVAGPAGRATPRARQPSERGARST